MEIFTFPEFADGSGLLASCVICLIDKIRPYKTHGIGVDVVQRKMIQMKKTKKILCMALALCLLISVAPVANAYYISDFADVPTSHWAYPYVRACANVGIVQGVSGNRFAPGSMVTAEQFVTLVGRACFDDQVRAATNENDTWSSAYIRVARELELLDNVEIEDVSKPIRRCDMAMLLFNICTGLQNKDGAGVPFGEQTPSAYDMEKYAEAISFCYGAGLLNGSTDGFFHGDDYLTRAQAAKVVALLAGLALEPQVPTGNTQLYILMYHSVVPDGTDCSAWTTTESQLRADLQWITEHGYTTVLPEELAAGKPLPKRAVLITFDDGYANNYNIAFPVLKEFNAKAVISPVVAYTQSEVYGFLTWDMCREMAASGLVEIGSHTSNLHEQVPGMPFGILRRRGESRQAYEKRVLTDIETSIQLLETNLDRKITFFAYPYGQTDAWASAFLRKHFAVTVTTEERVANISGGLYDLPRYNINSVRTARSVLPA